MKYSSFCTIMLVALSALLFSCKKEIPPTELQFTVNDNFGNLVSNADIKLYLTLTDMVNKTNQVGSTQYTNSLGVAKFTNLSPVHYYYFIEEGCLNNANGSYGTSTAISASITNTVTCVISSTGFIEFINNSTDPYSLYINGTYEFDLAGGYYQIFNYYPVGSYTLKVVQVSGYAIYPTVITFTGTLSCGSTLTATFP